MVTNPTVQTWLWKVTPGGEPLAGPFLVIAEEEDSAVPLQCLKSAFNASSLLKANSKQSLEMMVYQGLDYFPTVDVS